MSTATLINCALRWPGIPVWSAVCKELPKPLNRWPEIIGAANNCDHQLGSLTKTFASFFGQVWGDSASLECQMCCEVCLPNTPMSQRTHILKARFYLCLFPTIDVFVFFQITWLHLESLHIKDAEKTPTPSVKNNIWILKRWYCWSHLNSEGLLVHLFSSPKCFLISVSPPFHILARSRAKSRVNIWWSLPRLQKWGNIVWNAPF